jgi:site-specific recombinase XerD
MRQSVKKAGIIKPVTLHTLRHTFATHLLEEGLDLFTIKEQMGHSRITTTMKYVHIAQVMPKVAFSPLDRLYKTH